MAERIQRIDFDVELLRAILWQYNNAERLQSLLTSKEEWYEVNQEDFWINWIRDVFDLNTCTEFGATVWGIILNVPLSIGEPGTGAREVFGFGPNYNLNFDNGNFGRDSAGVAGLTIEQKRLVLKLRYYQLVSDGSVPWANYVVKKVFGQGYLVDHLDMTQTYIFPQALDRQVQMVLEQYDLLPRPAAVGLNININPGNVFGFEPYYSNFDNSGFGA